MKDPGTWKKFMLENPPPEPEAVEEIDDEYYGKEYAYRKLGLLPER